MTKPELKKLVATNAGIWALSTVASVILPFVSASITEGRGDFLQLLMHTGPLLVGLWISTALLGKSLGASCD